jgi:hypothetical protein
MLPLWRARGLLPLIQVPAVSSYSFMQTSNPQARGISTRPVIRWACNPAGSLAS